MFNKYNKYGRFLTSWYWLGVRNILFGLAARLGKPTTGYIPEFPLGFWKRDDIWRYSGQVWRIRFVCGYQVYFNLDGKFIAAPCCTLKNRPKPPVDAPTP